MKKDPISTKSFESICIIFPLQVETISKKGEMTDISSVKLLLDSIDLAIENPFFNMVPPRVYATKSSIEHGLDISSLRIFELKKLLCGKLRDTFRTLQIL